jgi:NADH-quinone oxidoreductase subunit B
MVYNWGEGLALPTKVDWLLNWPRKNSLWYLLFATACCGIELMQTGGPRTDVDRFGMVFRATPRQADLLLIAGAVTYKMADAVRKLYDQMPEPKYVLAMGSCANCGGLFQRSYSVVKGVDKILPVDIYLPRCAPRPEALNEALMCIQKRIMKDHWMQRIRSESEDLVR